MVCNSGPDDYYIDSPLVSVVYYETGPDFGEAIDVYIFIMQPIGFGVYSHFRSKAPVVIPIAIGVMFKVEDNWTPPNSNHQPACGGVAGIQCPEGMACIDDPSDDCILGTDADCMGMCSQ